jgi:Mn-dependent DtxR family transcriptional regulator
MRQPGEWMHLPTDHFLLEMLEETDMVLSPAVLARNLDYNRVTVSRRLTELTSYGLIERVDRGYYRINEDGQTYLDGDLDADTLDPSEE